MRAEFPPGNLPLGFQQDRTPLFGGLFARAAGKPRGSGPGFRRIGKNSRVVELDLFDESEQRLEFCSRLARKSYNDRGAQCCSGNDGADLIDDPFQDCRPGGP